MAERVTFERSLYLPEAVEAAAAAYAGLARVELATEPEAIVATVEAAAGEDGPHVVHGFCNHALYETITRRRQAKLDELG
jgi:hypothetical protein